MADQDDLFDLAARQHGLFTRVQASSRGLNRAAITRRIARGALAPMGVRVLRIEGTPHTAEQEVMAAILDQGAGAVATLDTAAWIWEIPGFRSRPVHLLVPRDSSSFRTPLAGSVHTSRCLDDRHTALVRGIPVVTPTRLLFELSASMHPERLARLIDLLWSRRLTSGALLHRTLDELARRGRSRIRVMRELLAERGPGYVPPESGLERRVHHLLEQSGLSTYRRQVPTGDATSFLGRMDFRDEHLPHVVQVDSDRHHASLLDRRTDADQNDALRRAGLVVTRLTEHEVWYEPRKAMARVRHDRVVAQRTARGSFPHRAATGTAD